jgi:post-segregation antitoxin (ccd killing protein)
MAQMPVTSFNASEGDREALADLARRTGVGRSRLARVAISRLLADPALDDLRAEAEALPDGWAVPMKVTSLHAPEGVQKELADLAAQTGVNRSRLIRVAIGRLDGVPLDDLCREAEGLPDGRRSKRPANSDLDVTESGVAV